MNEQHYRLALCHRFNILGSHRKVKICQVIILKLFKLWSGLNAESATFAIIHTSPSVFLMHSVKKTKFSSLNWNNVGINFECSFGSLLVYRNGFNNSKFYKPRYHPQECFTIIYIQYIYLALCNVLFIQRIYVRLAIDCHAMCPQH